MLGHFARQVNKTSHLRCTWTTKMLSWETKQHKNAYSASQSHSWIRWKEQENVVWNRTHKMEVASYCWSGWMPLIRKISSMFQKVNWGGDVLSINTVHRYLRKWWFFYCYHSDCAFLWKNRGSLHGLVRLLDLPP